MEMIQFDHNCKSVIKIKQSFVYIHKLLHEIKRRSGLASYIILINFTNLHYYAYYRPKLLFMVYSKNNILFQ